MTTSTQSNETDMGYGTILLFLFAWLSWFVGRLGEQLTLLEANKEVDRIFNQPPSPDSVVHVSVDEDGNVHRGIN